MMPLPVGRCFSSFPGVYTHQEGCFVLHVRNSKNAEANAELLIHD